MRSNLLGQAAVSAKNNMFGVAGLLLPCAHMQSDVRLDSSPLVLVAK